MHFLAYKIKDSMWKSSHASPFVSQFVISPTYATWINMCPGEVSIIDEMIIERLIEGRSESLHMKDQDEGGEENEQNENDRWHHFSKIPIGFRFMPTDQEIVANYLIQKASFIDISNSAFEFRDITMVDFYRNTPRALAKFPRGEREWFFFIKDDKNFIEENDINDRVVGDEIGRWARQGDSQEVKDNNGKLLAWKANFLYFSGKTNNKRKTHYSMDEYRLPIQFYADQNFKVKWVAARLRRGNIQNL